MIEPPKTKRHKKVKVNTEDIYAASSDLQLKVFKYKSLSAMFDSQKKTGVCLPLGAIFDPSKTTLVYVKSTNNCGKGSLNYLQKDYQHVQTLV